MRDATQPPNLPAWRALFVNHPLAVCMVLGLLVRLVAATVGATFHSRDDYFHVLAPAVQWLQDPQFDWEHSGWPGAGYRSHLLPRLTWWALRGLTALGLHTPEGQLRGLYVMVGLYSLWLIPAMFKAGERFFGVTTGRLAALAAAVFFPFPYAGTKLLIEGLAMPPLMAGIAALGRPSKRYDIAAGALFGLAFVWRFQCAVAVAGVGVALCFTGDGPMAQRLQRLARVLGGFAWVAVAGGLYDLACTGVFMGPMWRNLYINLHPHPGLSRSSPWAYLAFWLVVCLPPVGLLLLPGAARAGRKVWLVGAPWLAFVIFHSLVPHKEDRFMLPVVPLFVLLLAQAWVQRAANPKARGPLGMGVGIAMALGALILAITSQSQANLRDVMVALRQETRVQAVVSLGPELQTYYLQNPQVKALRRSAPDENWLTQTLAKLRAEGAAPNRFVAFAKDRNHVEVLFALEGLSCNVPQVFEGWWLDRMLQKLNPRRNQRRGPVLLYACDVPQAA